MSHDILHRPGSQALALRIAIDPRRAVGHALGEHRVDRALQAVASHLERALPGHRLVARLGLLDVLLVVDQPDEAARHELPGRAVTATMRAGSAIGAAAPLTPIVTVAPWRADAGDGPPTVADALASLRAGGAPDVAEPIPTAVALVALLGARDAQAATHAWHVATLAGEIASELGLDAATAARHALAGLVHDVGKVAVPDRILGNPGSLHEDEWAVMRRHPDAGAALLAHVPALEPTVAAVLHHHERIDGAGYPSGLAGSAIPLGARILAVADTYSALTAQRPYRAAYEPAVALRYVHAAAGTQLDAELVDALTAVVARGGARPAEAAALSLR